MLVLEINVSKQSTRILSTMNSIVQTIPCLLIEKKLIRSFDKNHMAWDKN